MSVRMSTSNVELRNNVRLLLNVELRKYVISRQIVERRVTSDCYLTRALLRLERTMHLLEGGKGGEGRMGERGWGGDGGRVGREGGEGTWGREGGWGEREGEGEREVGEGG